MSFYNNILNSLGFGVEKINACLGTFNCKLIAQADAITNGVSAAINKAVTVVKSVTASVKGAIQKSNVWKAMGHLVNYAFDGVMSAMSAMGFHPWVSKHSSN